MSELTENSKYGTETLEIISAADNFNRWMYETIRPYCHGNILEIGSGIGNISQFFVKDGADITISDIDISYFSDLENKFRGFSSLKGIHQIDLSEKKIEKKYPDLIGKFDTVFTLNVVEHIEDHRQALENAYKMLRAGGRVIILVPAFKWLYNGFDEQLGHYRRYNVRILKKLLESTGFRVTLSRYFNFVGILGWYFSGNILRKKMIPDGQMRLYNHLVPVWRLIDFFTHRFAGLSVIQVGEK
jgi:SAM-dependent methyltransferase